MRAFIIVLLGLGIGLVMLLELTAPPKPDWNTLTLAPNDKRPFGTYVLDSLLAEAFPGQPIERVEVSLYQKLRDLEGIHYPRSAYQDANNWLEDQTQTPKATETTQEEELARKENSQDSEEEAALADDEPVKQEKASRSREGASDYSTANYLIITEAFAPGEEAYQRMEEFVAAGNTVLIAAEQFGSSLEEEWRFDTKYEGLRADFSPFLAEETAEEEAAELRKKTTRLRFSNPSEKLAEGYTYRSFTLPAWFEPWKSGQDEFTAIAERVEVDSAGAGKTQLNRFLVAMRRPHGRGSYVLVSVPRVFSNYNLLFRNNVEFAFGLLSLLPNQPTYWDVYETSISGSQTSLSVVLGNPPLKWAYYSLAVLGLLALVFLGRRKQRPIPIIAPPQNTTVEFVETIGRLYYQNGAHKNIAIKRVRHFLNYVRDTLLLPTHTLDEKFLERLATKTAFPREKLDLLFQYIRFVRSKPEIEAHELVRLHEMLEEFYHFADPSRRIVPSPPLK